MNTKINKYQYFLILIFFSKVVVADRLDKSQMTLSVESAKTIYTTLESPSFTIKVDGTVEGEVVAWKSTSLDVDISRLSSMEEKNIYEESVMSKDLGQAEGDAIGALPGYEGEDGYVEYGYYIYPPSEFVTISPGSPYVRNIDFESEFYLDQEGGFLPPGSYAIAINYLHITKEEDPSNDDLEEEDQYLNEVSYFKITASGSEEATINHWLAIIEGDSSSLDRKRATLDALDWFTGITLADKSQLETAEGQAAIGSEYRAWWARNKDKMVLEVDEEDGSEYLVDPTDKRCISCYKGPILKDYGGNEQESNQATITLSGGAVIMYAGLREITITNSRLPDTTPVVTRSNYTQWQSDVTLLSGLNQITIEAVDFIDKKTSVTIDVIADFVP